MNLHSSRYGESFWQALVTLGDHHIERDHAARVLAFWSDLSRELLSEPDLSEADGAVRFTWCGDRYTLQVDVHHDGRVSWYFRDASLPPGQSEGENEQRPDELPARFWECVRVAEGERVRR
ncbi:MAG: hypothetical protein IPN17_27030 [Deltaproteobacteria bacterium]|nr:hypothetical protein [Deltaproteobacteria bacterium]